ncbi:hypothetical protein [Clostridium ihumii]|uniref:hypothetical protein n=1 Tax=Clostridium ihumii TaxID=1470356 RepID=UPI003D342DD8
MINNIHSNYNFNYSSKLSFSKKIVYKSSNAMNPYKTKNKTNFSNDVQPKNYQDEITYLYEKNLLNDCIDSNDKFNIKKIANKCGLNFEDCSTDDLDSFISGLVSNKLCTFDESLPLRTSVSNIITYHKYSQNEPCGPSRDVMNVTNINLKSFLKSQISNFVLWGCSDLVKEYEDMLKIIS